MKRGTYRVVFHPRKVVLSPYSSKQALILWPGFHQILRLLEEMTISHSLGMFDFLYRDMGEQSDISEHCAETCSRRKAIPEASRIEE